MTSQPELEAIARGVIDANRYMVLGTLDPDGRARVSPVYYAPDGYGLLYWISSYETHHSRNVAARPEVSLVVFDSSAPIGTAQAVYMDARAEEVPERELDQCAELACRPRFPEQRPFPREELRAPEVFRLYRARVVGHEIHIRGSDPVHGRGADRRMRVTLA